jgi:hypothetical protein
MAGEMFAARARSQASFAGTIVGIVTICLLIVALGWLVLSLFVPMFTLISKLAG